MQLSLPSTSSTKAIQVERKQNYVVGLAALLTSSCTSAFAGVYIEKVLKGSDQSLWIRNIYLSCYGIVFNTVTFVATNFDTLDSVEFFSGFDSVMAVMIGIQSFGGLLVAVVIKYAGNILKGFATALSIACSYTFSMLFLSVPTTISFVLSVALVIAATILYGRPNVQLWPKEPSPDSGKEDINANDMQGKTNASHV